MSEPFDKRLLVAVKRSSGDIKTHTPFTRDDNDTIASSMVMTIEDYEKRVKDASVEIDSGIASKIKEGITKSHDAAMANPNYKTQKALMNPYARIRLSGALDANGKSYLVDKAGQRPWYEAGNQNTVGYSKYPTTTTIIEYGNADYKARTPYQFQDFVFCKWWNKIPNNRLITLRRYTNPVLDNLENPSQNKDGIDEVFTPIVTAVSYFGDQTDNKLSEILKFSTGMKWGETSAGIWGVEQENDGTLVKTTLENAGNEFGPYGKLLFGGLGSAIQGLDILENNVGDGMLENGLPPDPYENGPYANRIMGPVDRIDTVKKRDAGLNFEMNGLKIHFDYVARPIGGINSKAVLLDILSNFLMMGSASAIFFGGAHRFRMHGSRFPAMSEEGIRKMYRGDVKGGLKTIGDRFANLSGNDITGDGLIGTILNAGKELLSNLLDSLDNPLGMKTEGSSTPQGENAAARVTKAIQEKIRKGLPLQYMRGMRALLVGEPVGEWHLTIGNPMNPIAMIGNLICTNIEVTFDDEAGLGPDDFPLAFRVTVSLDHGMPRDRDAIQSIFNRGNGRIYESDIKTSANKESTVDEQTGNNNNNQGNITPFTKYITTKTNSQGINKELVNKQTEIININTVGPLNLADDNFSIDSRRPTFYMDDWIKDKKVLN